MASTTEELNFKFYIILINLNSHKGLVATVLDSAILAYPSPHSSQLRSWLTSQIDITMAPVTK